MPMGSPPELRGLLLVVPQVGSAPLRSRGLALVGRTLFGLRPQRCEEGGRWLFWLSLAGRSRKLLTCSPHLLICSAWLLDEFVSLRQLFSQDLLRCSHSEQFFFDRCSYFTRCAPVWQVLSGSGLLRNVLDAFSISERWGLSCQQLPPRYISLGHIISISNIVITGINFTA
jgi:hypothetical protein